MWTASISRIALSTSLAVAGGLSLVGVLASLPSQDRAPAQPAPLVSGRSTALDSAGLQGGPGVTPRQTPELAQAIDRVESILAEAPSAGPAPSQAETAEADGPWGGTLAPDELGNLAPAAGRPVPNVMAADAAPSLPAEQPAETAAASVPQEPAGEEPRQTADRLPLDGDAGTGSETNSEKGAVAGSYMASTMREAAQSAPGPAAAQPAAAEAAASQVAAKQASAPMADRAASTPEAIGFVIIGSFRHHENAARHVGDHRDWLPQILTKQVGGTMQYRVAVGPFRAADLSAARQRVIANGIADAWLLPLGKAAATPLQTLDILG